MSAKFRSSVHAPVLGFESHVLPSPPHIPQLSTVLVPSRTPAQSKHALEPPQTSHSSSASPLFITPSQPAHPELSPPHVLHASNINPLLGMPSQPALSSQHNARSEISHFMDVSRRHQSNLTHHVVLSPFGTPHPSLHVVLRPFTTAHASVHVALSPKAMPQASTHPLVPYSTPQASIHVLLSPFGTPQPSAQVALLPNTTPQRSVHEAFSPLHTAGIQTSKTSPLFGAPSQPALQRVTEAHT